MLSAYNFRRDIFSLYRHKKTLLIPNIYIWDKIQKSKMFKCYLNKFKVDARIRVY